MSPQRSERSEKAPGKEPLSHCWMEGTSKDIAGILCPCAPGRWRCRVWHRDTGYGVQTLGWGHWGQQSEHWR